MQSIADVPNSPVSSSSVQDGPECHMEHGRITEGESEPATSTYHSVSSYGVLHLRGLSLFPSFPHPAERRRRMTVGDPVGTIADQGSIDRCCFDHPVTTQVGLLVRSQLEFGAEMNIDMTLKG